MSKWLILLVCAGASSLEGTASASSVLAFDDIATSLGTAAIPTGYGGLIWENLYVADGNYPPFYNTGFRTGTVTPPNTAFNGFANPATIRSTTTFDFTEAYFTSAYAQTDEPSQVQVDGYLGNELKYTRRISVVTSGPTLATLNYYGIDRLVFTSLLNPADDRRSQFVMDTFTFDANPVPPPPPPPPLCDERAVTIVGTGGNDDLTGTQSDDVIVGLDGDDIIDGLGGNDVICGNDGDDTLFGHDGNDRLFGGNGNDRLFGRNGNDRLFGGNGNDRLFGRNGNDRLFGGNGNDRLSGGNGRDVLRGGAGNDRLLGGRGIDTCDGQAGTDTDAGRCETSINIP